MRTIGLVNESKLISYWDWRTLRFAMQQFAELVAEAWDLDRPSVIEGAAPGGIELHVVDAFPPDAPANALGYHVRGTDRRLAYVTTTPELGIIVNGKATASPFGTIIEAGPGTPATDTAPALPGSPEQLFPGSLSEVMSHEIAEAMLDPLITNYIKDEATGDQWLVEIGDHAGAYRHTLTIGQHKQRVIVADFTLPAFYDRQGIAPFSYTGKVSAPFTLDQYCYGYKETGGVGVRMGVDSIHGAADPS